VGRWRLTPICSLLERFQKFCSHPVRPSGSGLFGFWLRFRLVAGPCGHVPALKPCQKPKILAPGRCRIFENALARRAVRENEGEILTSAPGCGPDTSVCGTLPGANVPGPAGAASVSYCARRKGVDG